MTNDEMLAVIDQVHAIAMDEADPDKLRSRLANSLTPVLERIEPVSWDVQTKGGDVAFRIANRHFKLDLNSQADQDGVIPKERMERQAESLRWARSRLQGGRPLLGQD
jgi:hypothetical protein